MSEQTARLVARLRERLRRTTRRITWAELAFGGAVAVGTGAGLWLLATLLEASLWLGTTSRTALVAAVGTVGIGCAATVLARPLGRLVGLLPTPSDEEVARKVGEHDPHVADRLVNLLQLAKGKRSHAPAPLVDRAVQDLADDLEAVSFEDVEDFGRARRAARLASLPLAGILSFLLVAPSNFLGASERILAPNTEFRRPAPFQLSIDPGDTRLVRGDSLRLRIHASGSPPETLSLQLRDSADTSIERHTLHADSTGTFRHTIPSVRKALQYRIDAPPLRTDWYEVAVANRPLVRRVQLTVTPPAYTGRSPRTLDPNVGDVTALPGTRVAVAAAIGGPPVKQATLQFEDDSTRSLDVRGDSASGSFTLQQEGTYHVRLESASGTTNRDPISYQMSLESDARPSATILQPETTTDLDSDLVQPLRVELSDDYGFSQAKLYYRVAEQQFGNGEDSFSSFSLSLPDTGGTDLELTHEWLLAQESGLDPEPGDVIAYYVRAWDNDTVNGPKSGRTATHRLRMPSLSEQYEQLGESRDETGDQMDELQQRSDSVRQQFQQLRDELRRTREADWQDQRQLERIQEKQRAVEEGAEKLSESTREMTRQMQENGLSSSETTEKFQELQRIIEEINSPDLEKALNQLREAMQNDNMRQMQEAFDQVQKTEQSQQERLERARSLFEQLKAQQKLEEMAHRAGDLSEREKTLREKTLERMDSTGTPSEPGRNTSEDGEGESSPTDSTSTGDTQKASSVTDRSQESEQSSRESTPDSSSSTASEPDSTSATPPSSPSEPSSRQNEDLAAEQERAAQQMQDLMEEMRRAKQEMKEVQSAPEQQLNDIEEELQQRDLSQQMQQNSQQLRRNQLQKAQQGQRQMQDRLQQMEQRLSKMKNQMQGQQQQINLAGLRNALENILRLSKDQESLRTTIADLSGQGPTVRSYARDQKTLSDGLSTVTDSLVSIARRVPEMSREVQEKSGSALRAMETATTALDERNAEQATGHQKTSMMHLNELALLLSDLLQTLQNQQGSGSGMSMQQMMQQLQQTSGQQQKLNKQIQQHLNDVQGERLSDEQGQRQKALAKQQRRIKKQLEEMNESGEARDQILGDLEKIGEQMEDTAQKLDQDRRPARDLIDRQQQILTRLLNAQKSLRTQGEEKQREGREAEEDFDRRPPDALPDRKDADKLHRDLIRALEKGYNPDYEELIKRYFDLLEEETRP